MARHALQCSKEVVFVQARMTTETNGKAPIRSSTLHEIRSAQFRLFPFKSVLQFDEARADDELRVVRDVKTLEMVSRRDASRGFLFAESRVPSPESRVPSP